ncbi:MULTISPECIES: GH1 family beta-glucosidase [unclassified Caulobacter]|uniref:GH1 family beta-glucosidase n=1 Tax=unclassified Caulobacter TaxID=2648921 RepID=UPI0006F66B47|nr:MULTISPECIES: GH1 family beta-glucosidase [unclassified Caulobacter]KQV58338.1 beta-galactosidase [Caulobacter sp. Root342]KQV69155.1 beta-galactosidase [Caulobacter sp. Root343]
MQRSGVSRRALGALALGGAAMGVSGCEGGQDTDLRPKSRQFPKDFVWGVATAAFQTEGSQTADGRGPSVWDVFEKVPGHVKDSSDATVATDSYRRFQDDVDLIAGAGLDAYRFSISWPRVLPSGEGAVNPAGLDHYSRLVDALLAKGVTPYATLFHWDLPQGLQDKGGWAARDTAQRLADYAHAVVERLGDRLKHYIILNEAAVHAVFGHVLGEQAPGLKDINLLGKVVHHMNLGQGLAMQALRAGRDDLSVGTTMALQPCRPAGGPWAVWNRLASDGLDALWNRAWLDPLFKGTYPKDMDELLKGVVQDGDLKTVKQPVDFLGVNYYAPAYVRLDLNAPSKIAAANPPKGAELDAFGRHIDPSGLFETLERVRREYGAPKMLVTENGCSDPFGKGPAILDDQFRIAYLRRHLEAVLAAREAGCEVGGYFEWTLIDNFEWDLGYTSKFGLVAMDRATGVRMPKASYAWFSQLAKSGLLSVKP